jgi:hypothetical protein
MATRRSMTLFVQMPEGGVQTLVVSKASQSTDEVMSLLRLVLLPAESRVQAIVNECSLLYGS